MLKRGIKSFLCDTRGNVAMVFALTLSSLLAAVGGGMDYSRSASIGTEMQAALDSGVLAAASLAEGLTKPPDPEEEARVAKVLPPGGCLGQGQGGGQEA